MKKQKKTKNRKSKIRNSRDIKNTLKKKESSNKDLKMKAIKITFLVLSLLLVFTTVYFLGKMRNKQKEPYLLAIQNYKNRNLYSSNNNVNDNNHSKDDKNTSDNIEDNYNRDESKIEKVYTYDKDENKISVDLSEEFKDRWVEKIVIRVSFNGKETLILPEEGPFKYDTINENKNYVDFEFSKNSSKNVMNNYIDDVDDFDKIFNYKNLCFEPFELYFDIKSSDANGEIKNIKVLAVKDYDFNEIKEKYQKIENKMK